jgi:all-beta uncharacterized protein/BACON domain-containing protein
MRIHRPSSAAYGLLRSEPLSTTDASVAPSSRASTVATFSVSGLTFSTAVASLFTATLIMSACGSSQTETATSPTPNKCSLQVTADGAPFPAGGGSGTVHVTANRECQWTAKTDSTWLTMTQPAGGQGDGSVRFSVAANADPTSRSASLAVNDQHLDIAQAGTPCALGLSSNHVSVDGAGGDVSIDVHSSATSCAWTAASTLPWIAIASGRDGHGEGTVTLHVDALTGASRSGTITIAGQGVQVDQNTGNVSSPGCTYGVATTTVRVDGSGGDQQIAVTSSTGCTWTAESRSSWITITSGASGTGSGAVKLHIASSDGPERSGVVVVANHAITVVQSLACTYSIAPSDVAIGAQAASSTVQIQTGAGCTWTASSAVPWITIGDDASGNGPGPVRVAAIANDGPSRTGTITIAGHAFTVTQANGCTYSVAPSSQDVGGAGARFNATVTAGAGCSWSASSAVDWVTLGTSSGSGSGQVAVTVKANASPPRTGTVSIAGHTLTIDQQSQCSWLFAPPSTQLPRSGGTGNVLVIVSGACSWTAVANVPWIQITAGASGTGNGLLQFVVPSNPNAARNGVISIGGVDYNVRQAGSGDSEGIK